MKVRWDVEVDLADALEMRKAGKEQYVSQVTTSLGPFDTKDEAERAANNIADMLPKNFPKKGGR